MPIDRSIIRRTFTILVVAPSVLYIITSSVLALGVLMWALSFIAMIEWTALKRHLKVNLLWAASSVNRISSGGGSNPSSPQRLSSSAAQSTTTTTNKKNDNPEVVVNRYPSMELENEYPLPVAKTNLFIIWKCIGSTAVTFGAMLGGETLHFGTTLYFMFWVLFTLMGRNRAETTAVAAKQQVAISPVIATTTSASSSSREEDKKTQNELRNANMISDIFHTLELQMIAEFFTTELFLSFCLEYFGFVWITGLSYSVLMAKVPRVGVLLMVTVLVSNWANDIAALIVGRSLKGRTRPLYPKLSPNKSLEGAIAGVLANGVFASALVTLCGPTGFQWGTSCPAFAFFIIGIVLGVFGVMGDLLQSLFKRTARLKDTGAIFPGHGGVLDRIDGLLIAYPVAYWLLWLALQLEIVIVS